ncbi:MAG: hypothetical protein KAS11_02560 [Candidatus Aenigmarchaeota archaeon]|nr:hypothetical protein [Candidatus Aenigmarchaeota archaeon]
MYNKLHMFFGVLAMILISSVAFAEPGIPHQFYGTIYVNGVAAPDNTILMASVDGDTYSTITTSSYYGKYPSPIFYVPDPNKDRVGETISFSVNGKSAGTHVFEDCYESGNCYDELNFELTTECGDGFCLGDETCSTCPDDCGICPVEDTVITVVSPMNDVIYNDTSVPLEVYADQNIVVWMYSLNDKIPVVFMPNTTMNVETGIVEGVNNLTVIAINDFYISESVDVSFTVEIPETECGNNVIETGEECDGSDLGGLTCSSYGYNAGSLSCSSECTIVRSGCYTRSTGGGGSSSSTTTGGTTTGSITTTTATTDDNETSDETDDTSPETTTKPGCTVNWVCSDWSECEDSVQIRRCIDANNCDIEDYRPSESQACIMYDEASIQTTQSSWLSFPTGFASLASITESSNLAFIGALLLLIILIFYIKKKLPAKNGPKTYYKSK